MYDSKICTPETDRLVQAILSLQTEEDCYRFFEDICTIKEIRDMTQRLDVARRLKSGETVLAISKQTGASTTTVSRVNRCLHYGTGGYATVLEKLEK